MSAYTTQAAIQGNIQLDDLIALTDDDPVTGNVNQTVLNQVIQNASDMIDGHIGNIYDTPVAVPVPPIPTWALTIACYMLYRRREVPDEKNKFTEEYRMVLKNLGLVNDGKFRLGIPLARDFAQVAVNERPSIYGGGSTFVCNSM